MGSFVPKIQTNEWPGIAKREENCQQEASGDAKPAPGGTDRQPRARQAPDRRYCQSRLAALSHRRAVAGRIAPCLVACAWRWDPSARRQFSLMWQVDSFSSVFARENRSWTFWSSSNAIWRAWRSARACGNSSIFLFVSLSLPFFHFVSLSSPWQWRAKPIFVGVRCSHLTLMYFRMVWIYIYFFHWFLVSLFMHLKLALFYPFIAWYLGH